jgi:hypothetical protein
MADDIPDRSATPIDPEPAESDDDAAEAEDHPPDDSFLLGVPGVEEEVLAELARTEATLHDPGLPADESDGAVV